MESLTGKVAVVTGGANGLGLGLADAFAEEGMRLVLADIATLELERAVASFEARGVEVLGVNADVSDPRAVDRLRDAAYKRFGTVHVLCNNAGIGGGGPLTQPADLETWHRVFAVDLFATLYGLDSFLPRMLEQDEGHVVNTSSRQGLVASPGLAAYPPAKAGLVAISEMLLAELGSLGSKVGVSVLTPGGVLTPLLIQAKELYERGEITDPAGAGFLQSRVANAVEPLDVGRLVVRAITMRRLYVNTHAETLDWFAERHRRMVEDAAALGVLR
jgi:NAD(P)-dependent dehydrogenase (short-subunit alcohol dehydrogenase family)